MDEPSPHEVSVKTYAAVFFLLLVLLIFTTAVAFMDLDRWLAGRYWSISAALLIAAAKGLLIILYFMHVRFNFRQTAAFVGVGFVWLAILFTLTMSDYLTRNAPADVNLKGEPKYLMSSHPSASRQSAGE